MCLVFPTGVGNSFSSSSRHLEEDLAKLFGKSSCGTRVWNLKKSLACPRSLVPGGLGRREGKCSALWLRIGSSKCSGAKAIKLTG